MSTEKYSTATGIGVTSLCRQLVIMRDGCVQILPAQSDKFFLVVSM